MPSIDVYRMPFTGMDRMLYPEMPCMIRLMTACVFLRDDGECFVSISLFVIASDSKCFIYIDAWYNKDKSGPLLVRGCWQSH